MNTKNTDTTLDKYYESIEKIILSRQNPITGLLPASTAITAHGDYTDAWVRDNVYSILCVWALGLSYKKYNPDHFRTHYLQQSVVKLMRGLLLSMMRQSHKVEKFKKTLDPIDALHAKYGTTTGLPVVKDSEWGHLQLDATSIFVLTLTQMIASGLRIIYTIDEVNFVQNLVHYISRTYCTPDFGIWERGHKINTGDTEINCSSVGMAKAALEAIDGFNLFGNVTSKEAMIHVIPSDIARSRFTLKNLLPRESSSKETDAALLSIIGYPAYAVENKELVNKTREKIIKKLSGNYGCKRFLLDGHQSSIEDNTRLHYEKEELRAFENIESEWPLFFTYLLLDAIMREDSEDIKYWKNKLEPLFVEEEGVRLLPELYYVPKEFIEAEKQNPGSQKRVPNENLPLVWAQSLYFLSDMILEGILSTDDIDPLNRRKRIGHKRSTYPMVALLCENETVKQELLNLGFNSEIIDDLKPLKVVHSSKLSEVHELLGKNDKLGLSGRPAWVPRSITTARLHMLAGEKVVFIPYYFNPKGFYFSYDNRLLMAGFRSSLKFLATHWDHAGQPILPFLVRDDMLEESQKEELLKLLNEIQNGVVDSVEVKTAPISQLLTTAAVERIDNLHGYELKSLDLDNKKRVFNSSFFIDYKLEEDKEDLFGLESKSDEELIPNLTNSDISFRKKSFILEVLWKRYGSSYELIEDTNKISLLSLAQYYYELATTYHDWKIVRRMADLMDLFDYKLEDALLEVVIRQKRLAVGRAYSEKATFSRPMESSNILKVINEFCGKNKAEKVLTQEILLHLGQLLRDEPKLFEGMITLRTWYFVQLLVTQISRTKNLSLGDAYEYLISLAPHEIYENLKKILGSFSSKVGEMKKQENLHLTNFSNIKNISPVEENDIPEIEDWAQYRKDAGMILKTSPSFYKDVWYLLQQCNGLVIGDKYNLNNRIGVEFTLDTTAGERNFDLRVDSLLQSIEYPDYRQLNLEVLKSLSKVFKNNREIKIDEDLMLDVLIGHAVRLAWEKEHLNENYDEQRGIAWSAFYKLSPKQTNEFFIEAFMHLLTIKE